MRPLTCGRRGVGQERGSAPSAGQLFENQCMNRKPFPTLLPTRPEVDCFGLWCGDARAFITDEKPRIANDLK